MIATLAISQNWQKKNIAFHEGAAISTREILLLAIDFTDVPDLQFSFAKHVSCEQHPYLQFHHEHLMLMKRNPS
jgi:hypothetical protein